MKMREFLKANRLSQSFVANNIGITRQAMNDWCIGKRMPTMRSVMRTTEALNKIGIAVTAAEVFAMFAEGYAGGENEI